jgi:hypothetical protein
MFIVYGYDHPRGPNIHYASGIFLRREDAEAYMASVPPEVCKTQRLEEIPQKEYPLYLIEEDFHKSPARPITRHELAIKMAMMPKVADEDHVYFNIYLFQEDYRGIRPGEDCMGSTNHTHVDNDYIIWSLDGCMEEGERPDIQRAQCRFHCNMCGAKTKGKYSQGAWTTPKGWLTGTNTNPKKYGRDGTNPESPLLFCGQECHDGWFEE